MTNAFRPTAQDPLFILAMDHRASFGATLFGVTGDTPTPARVSRMQDAKRLIYSAVITASSTLPSGRVAVLVDERYGQSVIDEAKADDVILAIPVEASGVEWFRLEWGDDWLEHVQTVAPTYAKVLIRDNPELDGTARGRQLDALAAVSRGLDDVGVPLIYELLVPPTALQLQSVAGDHDHYDSAVRPELTVRLIDENQRAGVLPALWKLEGYSTVEGARAVSAQAAAGMRPAEVIVLGRDAPVEQLDEWIDVAALTPGFVGFAIGRSIWEDPLRSHLSGEWDAHRTRSVIADRYLHFAQRWSGAGRGHRLDVDNR
jgi:myo-inositol catabolism protein IolC